MIDFFSDEIITAVLGFLAGTLVTNTIQRSRQAHDERAAAFRAVFNEVVLNLKANPDLPSAQIARLNHSHILFAAGQFRPHVLFIRRKSFDNALVEYKNACEEASEGGSILAQFASENGDYARAKRKRLENAVMGLLSFAG